VSEGRDPNPLVERVDALLKRHRDATGMGEDDVPVLTEVVDAAARVAVPPAGADALAAEIERAVLERLAPEIEDMVRSAVREAVVRALAPAREPGTPGS
jgi:hypothetical protein